jgi:predicted MFS family arabinose efflux permease
MVLPHGHRRGFSRAMTPRQIIKFSCFTLEGLNSFATVFYFNYLYFLMRDDFGYDNKRNLALAAALGLIYALSATQTGKFAQHRGYFAALKAGYSTMAVFFVVGFLFHLFYQVAFGQILSSIGVTVGMSFIWPTLEAFASDGETADGLPRIVGIYNVVWAATAALAFFIGGTVIHLFKYDSIFILPLAIILGMLGLTFWLHTHATEMARDAVKASTTEQAPHQPASQNAKVFLRMALLANPFAYIGIQTLIAVIPGIAAKFQMSPMLTGFVCSFWYFVRFGAFIALWRWEGWHYRFRWLAAAFAILVVSFAAILMSPNFVVLIAAQIFFGAAIGLIYYSSLFYSMDASDTRGEHGGVHEAVIGLGNCVGPAVGALSLQFLPQYANSGAIAVSVLLLCGFGGLVGIWKMAK